MSLDDPTWRSIVEKIDRLELGEGLLLGVDHYLHARDDTRVVRKVQLETEFPDGPPTAITIDRQIP